MSNFVSLTSEENKIRLNNLFNAGIFIGFAWILFHFTIIFFFGLYLESILLTGIFLGIGNLTAMTLDIPIGTMQKYLRPKVFLIIGVVLMLAVSAIFLKFAYVYDIETLTDIEKGVFSYVGVFLNSGINILLLLLCAIFYGIIKETFDVTIISYIFNNASPSEYAGILSNYNIRNGGGSMVGLIFAGVLLAFDMRIAIIIFIIILGVFLAFVARFFDNKIETIDFESVKSIKLDVLKNDILSKKDELIGKINTKNLIELSRQSRVILLKPIEIKKSIDFGDVYKTSLDSFKIFYNIILGKPRNILVVWFLSLIMLYGFWDAFVATFLVEFFNKVIGENKDVELFKYVSGYVLLGMIVIPAFLFQQPFINLSKKIGVFQVIMIGNILSAVSLVFFGMTDDYLKVMMFGVINSVGYAATMPLAQATFSGLYNESYAKKFNLKEIDATISAAPLKILINATNVLGIVFGAMIVNILGFNVFFIIYGIVIGIFVTYSILYLRKELLKFSKEGVVGNAQEELNDLKKENMNGEVKE